MSIHSTHLRLVVAGLSVLSLLACGDDEGSKKNDVDAGSTTDGGLVRVDGGPMPIDGAVPGDVGYPCSVGSDCDESLECIPHTLPGMSGLFGFCGKPCTTNAQCETDQLCNSDTGTEEGFHCADLVHEEFGICGPAVAAVCDGRACLIAPQLPVGVCVNLCTLDAASEDAGVEDGGVGDVELCRPEQACMDVLGDPTTGVCGEYVARGEACGISRGAFCNDEDVCAPVDVNDPNAGTKCFQSCADPSVTCAEGECLIVGGRAFCQ